MLIYLCDELNTTAPDGPCHDVDESLNNCFSGLLIGAWAVGGEVSIYYNQISYQTLIKDSADMIIRKLICILLLCCNFITL